MDRSLRFLDLRRVRIDKIRDLLPTLVTRFPNLESINLSDHRQLIDDDLQHLSELKKLKTLHLSFCRNTEDDTFFHLQGMEGLQTLSLAGSWR